MNDTTVGGYILVMQVDNPVKIQIGKLGSMSIDTGSYYYGGSAKRGIEARIKRHFSKNKNRYWHIDYITSHSNVNVKEAWCYPGFPEVEHRLSSHSSLSNAGILRGFGNGDCQAGCSSHLWKAISKLMPEDFAENYYIAINSE